MPCGVLWRTDASRSGSVRLFVLRGLNCEVVELTSDRRRWTRAAVVAATATGLLTAAPPAIGAAPQDNGATTEQRAFDS